MNGYPNEHDDEYADDRYGYEDDQAGAEEGDGEEAVEAEARRQAEAYHAAAAEPDHGYGNEADRDAYDDRQGHDHSGHSGDFPRESRKERRRREAAERQARAEAEAAAMTMRAQNEPTIEAVGEVVERHAEAPQAEAEAPAKSGKFGRWFGKSSKGGEGAMAQNRSSVPPIEIVLPCADRIDPAALTEFGLDPNTLAAMGMDPATLPQFEPEFLIELGINPQIVVEILRRQKLAEMGANAPEPAAYVEEHAGEVAEDLAEAVAVAAGGRKFDMSPAAWIARYRKVQKWAPVAAAAAGLTTTGSIWFMSGGGPDKAVEKVQNEQLAGENAEKSLGDAVAKQEEPGISSPEVADAGSKTADAGEKPAEVNKATDAPTDPAAAPVSLAMNDLPALPATPPGGDEPAAATPLNEPPGTGTAEAPPGLPVSEAPPGLPETADLTVKAEEPAPDAAPPKSDGDASNGESGGAGSIAKKLAVPAIGGIGAAAALGAAGKDALAQAPPIGGPEVKSGDGMPELPKSTEPAPSEAPPGLPDAPPGLPDAPKEIAPPIAGAAVAAELPPIGGNPAPGDVPPGADAPAPPADAASLPLPGDPPAAELPKEPEPAPKEPDSKPQANPDDAVPSISIPNASKSVEPAASDAGKAAAAAGAGAALGLGAGLAANEMKAGSNPADPPGLPGTVANEPPPSAELPKMADVGSEPPPGMSATSEPPPGSLAGLPKDIPQTPAAEKPAGAGKSAKPSEADANWPSIPNSRGKVLRALASTNPVGRNVGRSATAAALGAGAGLAMGTAISNGMRGSEPVETFSTPVLENAPTDIAPIRHTVQSGENFWTISRDYYGSGRYYKALWAANAARIGKIDELHVGDVVAIPSMENLDKSLIDTPNVAKSKKAAGSGNADDENPPAVARSRDARAVRTQNEIESVPVGGEPGQKPARKPVMEPIGGGSKEIVSQPIGETSSNAGFIRHRVQPGETLRTIAANRLGNARRADEIVELNPDVLDDVRTPLEPDMVLKLPVTESEE
ncbi:LysM peptidoglycan-binding domain-containing protein [bacterium]|nr:LysM peptidoglycan-binding domain-containing protein [bacterium]